MQRASPPELFGARQGRRGRQAAGLGPAPDGVVGPPVLVPMARGAAVRGRICALRLTHVDFLVFRFHSR